MATFWAYLLGVRKKPSKPVKAETPAVAKLQDIASHPDGLSAPIAAIAARTALAPEEVMAEALRFADRHPEEFKAFLANSKAPQAASQSDPPEKANKVVLLTLILAVLIVLILMAAQR
jgi:hypothetical protein